MINIIKLSMVLGLTHIFVGCFSNTTEPEISTVSTVSQNQISISSSVISYSSMNASSSSIIFQLDSIKDVRDGQSYKTVKIYEQTWMAENLNYGEMVQSVDTNVSQSIDEKFCYNDNDDNCSIYGGLYQWHNVMGYFEICDSTGSGCTVDLELSESLPNICPLDWHVPTHQDWVALIDNFNGYTRSGYSLKSNKSGFKSWDSKDNNDGNSSSFSALPTGNRQTGGVFNYRGTTSAFWEHSLEGEYYGFTWNIFSSLPSITRSQAVKSYANPIRCIQD